MVFELVAVSGEIICADSPQVGIFGGGELLFQHGNFIRSAAQFIVDELCKAFLIGRDVAAGNFVGSLQKFRQRFKSPRLPAKIIQLDGGDC